MLTTCTPTKHGYAMVLVMMYAQGKKKGDANPISFARHWLKRVVWYLLDKWTWFQYRPPPAVGGGMVWTSKTCCPNTTIIGVEKQFPSHQKKWNQYNSYQSSCSLSLSHTQPFTEVLPHAHNHLLKSFHHNPATSGTGSMLPSDKKEKDIDTNYIKHEYTMLEELYRTFILFHTKWQHTFPSLQNMEQKLRLPCCKTLTTPADFPKPLKSLKGL